MYIRSRGGFFYYLAKRFRSLCTHMRSQWKNPKRRPWYAEATMSRSLLERMLYPLALIFYPLFYYVLPALFVLCDSLDRQRDYTLGYACAAKKPYSN